MVCWSDVRSTCCSKKQDNQSWPPFRAFALVWPRAITTSKAIGGLYVAKQAFFSVIVINRCHQRSLEEDRLRHQLLPIGNDDLITNGLHFICLLFGLECLTGLQNKKFFRLIS